MKLPSEMTKEELLNMIEKQDKMYQELSKRYDTLTAEAKELRIEISEINASAINFENKVERLLGKEALGIVMFGSKEAYERYMDIETRAKEAKTPEEKQKVFLERLAFESDDPFDQQLDDHEME